MSPRDREARRPGQPVPFEALGLSGSISRERLRLSLVGQTVAHHVEPQKGDFGPGSVLFFHAFFQPEE